MPEKEKINDPDPITRFFSKIGKGVINTGESTVRATSKIKNMFGGGVEEGTSASARMRELREMESREEAGGIEWEEEREELQEPFSERLSRVFYGIFKRPAGKLVGYFSGLDDDLDRANMNMSPERYISMLLGIAVIVTVATFIFTWLLWSSILISGIGVLGGFFLPILIGRAQPKSVISGRASEVNQEIPYALRHMASQLSSGVGLPETMASVSEAEYGALSEEFEIALAEMRRGESMTDALSQMQWRVDSDFLASAIRQIKRTLRTGGNLARTLHQLADEAAFDLRMNLRDYTQSLNMMTMVYMFGAGVIPPLLIVVMIISQFMGGGMSPQFVAILYLLVIPFLLFYLVIIFKRMEPEV